MFSPALARRSVGSFAALFAVATAMLTAAKSEDESPPIKSLTVVVMDPLALPLSCPCVKGYAQRKYEDLAVALERRLGFSIKLVFAESLTAALKGEAQGQADLIIGKRSVVEFDARRSSLKVTAVAALTGKDGETTQRGLIVVPTADPARSVADLKGYRLIFGPPECDEKHAAALALLKEHGVAAPAELETAVACDEGAAKILDAGPDSRGAAVISSYAKPLLEGCGAVPKGALRVVARTAPVPFIVAFAGDRLSADERGRLRQALLDVGSDPALRLALETRRGFVPLDGAGNENTAAPADDSTEKPKPAAGDSSQRAWSGWRGQNRDAIVDWLPRSLPDRSAIRWRTPLTNQGLAGVAADEQIVVVADRDAADKFDIFRCLSVKTGEQLWAWRFVASGELDYGNSARATPLLHDGLVYVVNAFGQLVCGDRQSGAIRWKKDLRKVFRARDERPWGIASSPLIVDGKLIVNPGGESAGVAALVPATGEAIWTAEGGPAAFSSFIAAELGGRRQLIGYDQTSLGGWDIATGQRIWRLEPPRPNDFNVPTPLAIDGRLLVTTENNGTRLYEFDAEGRIIAAPVAQYPDLAPDCHTPVAIEERLFGVDGALHCLDLSGGLAPLWQIDDDAFSGFATLIAGPGRLLATTQNGELLLVDIQSAKGEIISRLQLFEGDTGVFSHPALVGTRLFVRGSNEICCIDLAE
ncbi:MAG TPA: PQQ-binding-like beta-propeller repeat protein [Pirellulales bacterium]|nr:PQQ-binding-like beta-propeller repeat protein [Pirellulales bacterium]